MISIVSSSYWSDFYWSELMNDDHTPNDNYYQLFDSRVNEGDRRLYYFSEPSIWDNDRVIYFFYYVDDLIVGNLTFRKPPIDQNTPDLLWMSSVSVDPSYRNMGIATKLVKSAFTWAKQSNYYILSSSYEPDGLKYLKHIQRRISNEISIRFIDKERDDDSWVDRYYEWGTKNNGSIIKI